MMIASVTVWVVVTLNSWGMVIQSSPIHSPSLRQCEEHIEYLRQHKENRNTAYKCVPHVMNEGAS